VVHGGPTSEPYTFYGEWRRLNCLRCGLVKAIVRGLVSLDGSDIKFTNVLDLCGNEQENIVSGVFFGLTDLSKGRFLEWGSEVGNCFGLAGLIVQVLSLVMGGGTRMVGLVRLEVFQLWNGYLSFVLGY